MIDKSKIYEFIRFGIVGVAATATHYGIYLLLLQFINTSIAYSIGYLISFTLNFYLSSSFTFKQQGSLKKVIGFALSHLANYILHIVLLNLFINLGIAEQFAPAPVFAIAIPVNFVLVRFVFKSKMFQ